MRTLQITSLQQKTEEFFQRYEARFNRALQGKDDIEGTINSFAEYFVEASTVGVHGGKNDDSFQSAIPKGNAFYRKIGTKLMKVKDIQVQELNAEHVAAHVQWHSVYQKKDNTEVTIDFEVIYLLQWRNKQLKIFAYITGDEQSLLKENGLA